MNWTIITSDYYNALYEDGVLKNQGKPDYLHGETMANLFPHAAVYGLESHYETLLEEDGYPVHLSDFPLEVCTRYR